MESKRLSLENTYINLPDIFYSKQDPRKVPDPELVIFNDSLADELGLDKEYLKSKEGIELLSGNKVLEDTIPIAQAYAGHQFGYFTMLGDGRAVLLGEFKDKQGKRYDLQLKGSGRTPYSRGGDGKAALGPMLREYIISEAMHSLGIETTRSLAVVKTGEKVLREEELEGAVLSRIALSHIRVGTFQYAANFGSIDDVKALADYTLKRHFNYNSNSDNPYLYLLNTVIKKQAELIAKWQLCGFIHGVMNTDNVSISCQTIDYGPCAFMDTYDPKTVFSSIDTYGRYAYENQPKIGVWNLARFAETLFPLIDEDDDKAVEIAERSLKKFSEIFDATWMKGMRSKLGLYDEEENDKSLIDKLLSMMKDKKADYTNTFYYLTAEIIRSSDLEICKSKELENCSSEELKNLKSTELENYSSEEPKNLKSKESQNYNSTGLNFFKSEEFKKWHKLWIERLKRQNKSKEEIIMLMESSNPAVIPRNHRVEEALKAAVDNDDYSLFDSLLEAVKNPYDYSKLNKEYTKLPKPTGCKYKTYCGT